MSAAATYASHVGMALAIAGLTYAFRANLAKVLAPVTRTRAASDDKHATDAWTASAALAGLTTLALAVVGLPLVVALAFGGIVFLVAPAMIEKRRRASYVRAFDQALADSLQTLASSLKAGLTLKDSLHVAVENCPPVFAREVGIALKEYHFGTPIEEALDKLRRRIGTPNCNIAFGSMIISSKLGGRLPEMLRRIVVTVRERERVEGRLKALTAQGRAQAGLLCAAPPVLGFGMYLYDPGKMALLTDYWVGQILLCIAIVLEAVGIFVTARVMRLEV